MNKISRIDNSVVFLDKTWNEFYYFYNVRNVVVYFDIKPLTYEEYQKTNILNTFINDLYDEYRKYLISAKYKIFYEKYKITPANFKKIFNAIMLEIWSVRPYCSDFCYNYKGSIVIDDVIRLHKKMPFLKEAEKNNKKQIIPFIFYTGLVESDIEEFFGKEWENVLKNSKTRNLLICKKIFKRRENKTEDFKESSGFSKKDIVHQFSNWNKVKYCVLKSSIFSKFWCIPKHEFAVTCIIDTLFNIKNIKKVVNDPESRKFVSEIINFLYRNCRFDENIEEKYLKYSKDEWRLLIKDKVINATF